MKRLITIIAITFILSSAGYSSGIGAAKEKLYDAYISGNNSLWLDVMVDLEESYKISKNVFTLHELAKSQYGYMGFLIDRREFEKAKLILPDTEKHINNLLDYNDDWADVHGLKAGIYGFKIILYPNYVILNGPKGKGYLNKAKSLNEITPSVLVEMANYKYHTPSILGGDIDEAIQYYQYAIKLFELTKQSKNNWQYINTTVWLAISLDKIGKSSEAKKVLQKLLVQEPDFDWVKNDLYPKILRNESISKTYYSMNN
ncbi:tetratricopeptide repeat protein [Bacteroidota bacterium]